MITQEFVHMHIRPKVNVGPQKHKPDFMVQSNSSVISTPVMLNKRDKHIPKLMRAIMNKLISVMKINKLDIGLTKRARLDKSVIYSSMIAEEEERSSIFARRRNSSLVNQALTKFTLL
jgi:hypothetical protein